MGIKILRLIIISIISLFLVLTIISLFIPSDIRLAKVVNVQTVADSVWPQLDNMKNWENWYPGMKDTAGRDLLVLDSSNGRTTKIRLNNTVIRLNPQQADEITADLEKGKRHNKMGWKVISYTQGDFVTVQWYMDIHLKWYPWQKFASLLFEKMYNPQMEKGLQDLKARLEQNHSSNK
jgi:hypothetical protein